MMHRPDIIIPPCPPSTGLFSSAHDAAAMHKPAAVIAVPCPVSDRVLRESWSGSVKLADLVAACSVANVQLVLTPDDRPKESDVLLDKVMAILNSPYRATGATDLLTQVGALVEKLRE